MRFRGLTVALAAGIALADGCGSTGGDVLTAAQDGASADESHGGADGSVMIGSDATVRDARVRDGRAEGDVASVIDASSPDSGSDLDAGPGEADAASDAETATGAESGAGTCDPSMTEPVALVSMSDAGVAGVAIDANWVYFGTYAATGIARVAKTGGPVQTPAIGDGSAGDLHFPGANAHLALDELYVYWPADGEGVARVPIATFSEATPSLILPLSQSLRGLAVDATRVYLSGIDDVIYSGPKGGGSFTPFATGGFTDDVVADSSGVYWADENQGLFKAADDGGAPILLFGSVFPLSLALDATSVYATSGNGILRVNKDGTNPAVVIPPVTTVAVYGIAVDDQFVYWVDAATADAGQPPILHKAPKVGGTVVSLATAHVGYGDIAVDGSCVYFADSGSVMRVRK